MARIDDQSYLIFLGFNIINLVEIKKIKKVGSMDEFTTSELEHNAVLCSFFVLKMVELKRIFWHKQWRY